MPFLIRYGKKNFVVQSACQLRVDDGELQCFLINPDSRLAQVNMNFHIKSLVLSAAMVCVAALGCKLSSSGADTTQNSSLESSIKLANSREENSNQTATNAPATPTPSPKSAANAVCPDPAKPCQNKILHFDDWALSFKVPARPQPNKTYRSEQFYSIILKTYEPAEDEDCDGGEYIVALEEERKQLQQDYPDRKVFASYLCPNMGATEYDFPGKMDAKNERVLIDNFIAIYAGKTKEEAEKLRQALLPQYPKAVIKPMTATAEWIYQ